MAPSWNTVTDAAGMLPHWISTASWIAVALIAVIVASYLWIKPSSGHLSRTFRVRVGAVAALVAVVGLVLMGTVGRPAMDRVAATIQPWLDPQGVTLLPGEGVEVDAGRRTLRFTGVDAHGQVEHYKVTWPDDVDTTGTQAIVRDDPTLQTIPGGLLGRLF